MVFLFEIMEFSCVAEISLNYVENTGDRPPKCYQKDLRFHIEQTEMFAHSICLGLMENLDKRTAKQISAVFVSPEHFDCGRVFSNRSFRAFKQAHFSEPITSQLFKL